MGKPDPKPSKDLEDYFLSKQAFWESLCINCGGCCGAYDDPCKHLRRNSDGKYFCLIYDNRFGTRETVKGEKFDCVMVKEIIETHWINDHLCAYKKYLKNPWIKP